jgi:FkbM family methyltransferase
MQTLSSDTVPSLSQLLQEPVEAVQQREQSALDSLLAKHNGRVVLFGAGTLGRKAISLLRALGVEPLAMSDNAQTRWNTSVDGVQVLSPEAAAVAYGASALFLVTIWNDHHWFNETRDRLTAAGALSVVSYAPLFWRFGSDFMDLLLLNEPPHRLYKDAARVLEAEALWGDKESQDIYRGNVLWRALGDPSHLPSRPKRHTYFPEDLVTIAPDDVIVDCGAFDGDTVRQVISLAPSGFQAIYSIEADATSNEKMSSYIASLPWEIGSKIHMLDCAVGKTQCIVHFAFSGSLTSKMGSEGREVQCMPIDDLFPQVPITILKMDIEGAETDALEGARKVIARDRPLLAICIYHTQHDLWTVPLLIRALLPAHCLYLRAYEGDGFQTVCFAVPPERHPHLA